jgi:DNA-binding response OmpR family regulator
MRGGSPSRIGRSEATDLVTPAIPGEKWTVSIARNGTLARVRLRLRQQQTGSEHGSMTTLTAGYATVDIRAHTASRADRTVELAAREFSPLEMLVSHAGQVLSREQILSGVWGYDYDPGGNVVAVYVRNLRRKLGDDIIETVRGMGYRLHG